MSTDVVIRVVAVLAAVGVVSGPTLAALAAKAKAYWQNREVEAGAEKVSAVTGKDLHIVLDLATRLKAAGCMAGVALCQELIDVMLGNAKAAKK